MIFNTIPLGQPYHNFKLELQKKGFTYQFNSEKEADNTFSYSGKFIDKEVHLEVMATPKTKTVWKVNVELPESKSWTETKTEFFDLCNKLTSKYGAAYQKKTVFANPNNAGDGNELQAIFQNKCTYFYNWKTENGLIVIKVSSHTEGSALIIISYEDKNAAAINATEKDKTIMDGL
jgi:hypothetical protein